jgi:hypothetical protein
LRLEVPEKGVWLDLDICSIFSTCDSRTFESSLVPFKFSVQL